MKYWPIYALSLSVRPGHGSKLGLGEDGGAGDEKEEEEDGVLAGRITIPKLSKDFMLPPVEYEQDATCCLKRSLS